MPAAILNVLDSSALANAFAFHLRLVMVSCKVLLIWNDFAVIFSFRLQNLSRVVILDDSSGRVTPGAALISRVHRVSRESFHEADFVGVSILYPQCRFRLHTLQSLSFGSNLIALQVLCVSLLALFESERGEGISVGQVLA